MENDCHKGSSCFSFYIFGRERKGEEEDEEVKKRKGKRQREENRGSCVDVLKLFRAATNLRAAHGSYV